MTYILKISTDSLKAKQWFCLMYKGTPFAMCSWVWNKRSRKYEAIISEWPIHSSVNNLLLAFLNDFAFAKKGYYYSNLVVALEDWETLFQTSEKTFCFDYGGLHFATQVSFFGRERRQ